jgi:hypothetical protein
VRGFVHVCRQVWLFRVPVPFLGLTADGATLFHADGKGWYVYVSATSKYVGTLVSYTGHVRLT